MAIEKSRRSPVRTNKIYLLLSILSLYIPKVFPQFEYIVNNNNTDFIDFPDIPTGILLFDEEGENVGVQIPTYPPGSTSLTFVFDKTGSMYDDLVQVREGARRIMETMMETAETPLYNYVLVPFHDPHFGPALQTRDHDVFLRELQDLYVQGGGDCPEMSISAIKVALEVSLPGSLIYVFTDARAKDYNKTHDVLKLIQEKESQVVFVMTGDCGNQSHPGFQAYEQIAATSSGQVFRLNKSDVEEVLRFVELSVQARKVNLIATDSSRSRVQYHLLPVDSRLRQFTISISGVNVHVRLTDHNGNIIPILRNVDDYPPDGPYLEELLMLDKAYILVMKNPQPGVHTLQVSSSSGSTLRVQGMSLLDFGFGFSRYKTFSLNETSNRPLRGVRSHLLIRAKELSRPGYITKVEFLNLHGDVIPGHVYNLVEDRENPGVYSIDDLIPPFEYFYIRVSGIDSQNYRFHRITATSVHPMIPDPPAPKLRPRTPGYYGRPITLRCHVDSILPFTIEWKRGEVTIGRTRELNDSQTVSLDIGEAHQSLEDVYSCIARSMDGLRPLQGIAHTYVDVTEPPPVVSVPQNISVVPGHDAILTCDIFSTVPFNVTWDKPSSDVSLRRHNRINLMRNGSLYLFSSKPADGGRYRCIASNEGGNSYKFVHVFVQESPKVNTISTNQSFTLGDNITISCSASGFPSPQIRWIKDGTELTNNMPQFVDSGDGYLSIIGGTRDLAGVYICFALNDAGMDSLYIYVSYNDVPVINTTTNAYLVPPGQNARLECVGEGRPQPHIMWFKGGLDLGLTNFAQVMPDGSLIIRDVQVYDRGEYMCVAANDAGSATLIVQLNVGAPPTILQGPNPDIGYDYGQNFTISCIAQGSPQPIIRWQKVGMGFFDSYGRIRVLENGHLFVEDLEVDDRGTYICVAENEFGSTDISTQLRVTNLVQPSIGAVQPIITATQGDTVSLLCEIVMGNPPPQVQWYRDGRLVVLKDSKHRLEYGRLVIDDIQPGDSSTYMCIASNSVGNTSVSSQLVVQIPPTIGRAVLSQYTTPEHTSVTLLCPVEGFPIPRVEWLRNGRILTSNEVKHYLDEQGSLVIPYVLEEDEGSYTCSAHNPAGRVQISIDLHVMVAPEFDGPEGILTVNATHGSRISLHCDARSNPPPTFSWLKDGIMLPPTDANHYISSNGTLVLKQLNDVDGGIYLCFASNEAGNATQQYSLDIFASAFIADGPTDVNVIAGDPVTLECEANGKPKPEVVWQKDGSHVRVTRRRFSLLGSGSLMILSARETDTGIYTCVASNEVGLDRRQIRLAVYVHPNITESYQSYEVIARNGITLYCAVTGFPSPIVKWTKDGIPMSTNDPNYEIDENAGTLEIISTNAEDTGVYECTASNPAGSIVGEIDLSVYVPPSLQLDGRNINTEEIIKIRMDDSAILPCEVTSVPPPVITWEMNDRPLPRRRNLIPLYEGSLQITRAQPSDAGVYKCIASNVAGTATKTFQVQVLVPPTITPGLSELSASLNTPVQLNCMYDGIPSPEVLWMKEGNPIDVLNTQRYSIASNGTLIIHRSADSDSGDYTCYVSNEAGYAVTTIELFVMMPPSILVEQSFYIVRFRSSVTLHCEADGIPSPSFTWLKDGFPITENDVRYFAHPSGSLRIGSTIRRDSGSYTCIAENLAGSDQRDIGLTVLVAPEFTDEAEEEYNITMNQPLSLPCSVDSYPPPDISWFKKGQLLSHTSPRILIMDGSLDVPVAKVGDSGRYRCMAVNAAGNISRIFDVNVQVPPNIVESVPIIIAMVGEDVILPCESIGLPVPMVMWSKEGQKLKSGGRFDLLPQGSLTLLDVQESDSGKYLCIVVNSAGSDSTTMTLYVNERPTIRNTLPARISKPTDSLIRLPCEVSGNPRPEIQWYQDGIPIVPFENGYTILNDGSLLISSLQPYDNGEYICLATNKYGNASVSVVIETLVKPHIFGENTLDNPVLVTTMQGKDVTLVCNVTDAYPPATIEWFKDDRFLTERNLDGLRISLDRMELHIPFIQQDDYGHYYCTAHNMAGEGQRHFMVDVNLTPVIMNSRFQTIDIFAGKHVTLACDAVGTPAPRIMWQFGSISLASSNLHYNFYPNGSMEMRNLDVIDSGNYTCIAKNRAGNSYRTVILNIIVPPSINPGNQDFSRVINSSVILPCESDGVPEPIITWKRNGIPLDLTPSRYELLFLGSLRVTDIQLVDSGSYECIAENDAGYASRNMSLHVHSPPFIMPNVPRSRTTGVDEAVTLQCPLSGSPQPWYTWKKNNRNLRFFFRKYDILSDGSLLIHNTNLMDSGEYVCVATNMVGVKKAKVNLEVTSLPKVAGPKEPVAYSALEGESFELQCLTTDAFPPPTIQWYFKGRPLTDGRNGVEISDNAMILTIDSINSDHSGQYHCIVSNAVGEVRRESNVKVLVPPRFYDSELQEITVMQSGFVTMPCQADGHPEPVITWDRGGAEINENDNHYRINNEYVSLDIMGAHPDDTGLFTCTASNDAGMITKQFQLTVLVPPSILPGPEVINAMVGEYIYLDCVSVGFPVPTISWEKELIPLSPNGQGMQFFDNGTIGINSVRISDSGRYTCIADNPFAIAYSEVLLVVNESPYIPVPTNTAASFHSGEAIQLHCPVSGTPPPIITWYKDDIVVDPSSSFFYKNGTLVIENPSVTDSGQYVCFAENSVGNYSITIDVSYYVAPVIESDTPQEYKVYLNGQEQLTCEVDAYPEAKIRWKKDGVPIPRGDPNYRFKNKGSTLIIYKAQINDGGRYTCIAENIAGSAQRFFGVIIMEPPSFIYNEDDEYSQQALTQGGTLKRPQEHSTLSLTCGARGTPPPTITWFKNGYPILPTTTRYSITPDGQDLAIYDVVSEDAGEIMCFASSEAGNASYIFTIDVYLAPRLEDNILENTTAIAGGAVQLLCPSTANPPPTITWYHNGNELRRYDNGVTISLDGTYLSIPNVQIDQEGLYQCNATNAVGDVQKFFFLTVYVPPTIFGETNMNIPMVMGNPVQLDCEASGIPRPTIRWRKNNQFISHLNPRYEVFPNGTLYIEEASLVDTGIFECLATNLAGNDSKRVALEVQVPPRIRHSHRKVTTLVNSQAELPCEAEGVPKPVIKWQRNNVMIDATDGYAVLEDGRLYIDSAKPSDSGNYICMAKNPAGTDLLKVTLEVQVPPAIEHSQLDYSARERSEITLECVSTGYPDPIIFWEFNGVPISSNSFRYNPLSNGALQIPVTRELDMGNYQCVAVNDAGEARATRYLFVQVPPSIPQYPNTMVVEESEDLVLNCNADGIPPPIMNWLKDGRSVPLSNRIEMDIAGTLTITNAEESDSGVYTCIATNSVGRASMEVTVSVHVSPNMIRYPNDMDVALGDAIELMCEATGFPTPTIKWYLNRTEIPSPPTIAGRSTLVRENAMRSDSGTYTCRAENSVYFVLRTFAVRVRVPARILPAPPRIQLAAGGQAILQCNFEGDPRPEVTWLKGGYVINSDSRRYVADNGSLILYSTSIEDAGDYTCRVYNEYGVHSMRVILSIKSPPIILIGPANVTVDLGDNILLDCLAIGHPDPQVTWRKDSFTLTPMGALHIMRNNSLMIVGARRVDTGVYTCEAYNANGRDSLEGVIRIREQGGWSEWSLWDPCSQSCGEGYQLRRRACDNPAPIYGGENCNGANVEMRECEIRMCPVSGRYGDWSSWGPCSATCSRGTKSRTRECNNPRPQYGGQPCIGVSVETAMCHRRNCPVDGGWGRFYPWSTCSASCGEGQQTRIRQCDNPAPRYGGAPCVGDALGSRLCKLRECAIDGGWTDWSVWSTCSQSCGGGSMSRTRSCSNPAPSYGGQECRGNSREIRVCNPEPCPIHGGWSNWDLWSICTATCDGGIQERYRSCTRPEPHYNGRQCPGVDREMRSCNEVSCSRDGNWSPWSAWSDCSATCGESTNIRRRVCNDPTPMNGGRMCIGDSDNIRRCDVPECVVGPRRAIVRVSGIINGIEFGNGLMMVNITSEDDDSTRLRANMINVPLNAGNALKGLISLLSPVYWTSAFEVQNAVNGYTLTGGLFSGKSQVSFGSGEKITMRISSDGLDSNGTLRLLIFIDGRTPAFTEEDRITINPYSEQFIQTGPGQIYGQSRRTIRINGGFYPVLWNQTIQFSESVQMPYLVQQVTTESAQVSYHSQEQSLRYGIKVYVSKGQPSNKCPTGFRLDPTGPYCRDKDECERNPCSHGCQNFPGGYVCTCPSGYRRSSDGHGCDDINECRFNNGGCGPGATCQNTVGSSRCLTECPTGFQRPENAVSCNDINECQTNPYICVHQCRNTVGSYECLCHRGYKLGANSGCVDINECFEGTHNCRKNQRCVNTNGGYQCPINCAPGFKTARNGSCADINECRLGRHNCGPRQDCHNTYGSYVCRCPRGYTIDRSLCLDINECRMNNPCTGTCINLDGDYECLCPSGMLRLPDRKTCYGRDQIDNFPSTLGCRMGFELVNNQCVDINECISNHDCQGMCHNTRGSYYCTCPSGYELASSTHRCIDINECDRDTHTCQSGETCINTFGSHRCEDLSCPPNYRAAENRVCLRHCQYGDTRCAMLDESIKYYVVNTPSGLPKGHSLIKLQVIREQDKTIHEGSHFEIIDQEDAEAYCNCDVPFQIRTESSGVGIVYTTKRLLQPQDHRIKVRAWGYRANRELEYQMSFILYISVSSYPYIQELGSVQ